MRSILIAVLLVGCATKAEEIRTDDQGATDASHATPPKTATGQPGAPGADSVSGTRLKAKVLVAEDGATNPVFLWRDTTKNIDCQFVLAADGKQRCLPIAGQPSAAGYYADAQCQSQITSPTAACTAPAFAVAYEPMPSTCGYGYRIYSMGGAYHGALYLLSGGKCMSAGNTQADYSYFYVDSEVPLNQFVAADYVLK